MHCVLLLFYYYILAYDVVVDAQQRRIFKIYTHKTTVDTMPQPPQKFSI